MNLSKIIFILCLFITSVSFGQPPAESIKWLTITEAEALAQKEPKKIIVDIYTDWCGWCKRLDATTYKDPQVVAYINQNFYAVKFNAESKEEISFKGTSYSYQPAQRVNALSALLMANSTGYPTTTFMNEKLDVISTVPGYQNASLMLNILHYFGENHYLKTDWNTYLSSVSSQSAPKD